MQDLAPIAATQRFYHAPPETSMQVMAVSNDD
jgi:hypothetical protein